MRQAVGAAVELVRDCGDWFPPLKAAAGGLANVLAQLEVSQFRFVHVAIYKLSYFLQLTKDNKEARDALARRVVDISLQLVDRACTQEPVDVQVARLGRYVSQRA